MIGRNVIIKYALTVMTVWTMTSVIFMQAHTYIIKYNLWITGANQNSGTTGYKYDKKNETLSHHTTDYSNRKKSTMVNNGLFCHFN